jgi:hypothetical protein
MMILSSPMSYAYRGRAPCDASPLRRPGTAAQCPCHKECAAVRGLTRPTCFRWHSASPFSLRLRVFALRNPSLASRNSRKNVHSCPGNSDLLRPNPAYSSPPHPLELPNPRQPIYASITSICTYLRLIAPINAFFPKKKIVYFLSRRSP